MRFRAFTYYFYERVGAHADTEQATGISAGQKLQQASGISAAMILRGMASPRFLMLSQRARGYFIFAIFDSYIFGMISTSGTPRADYTSARRRYALAFDAR